MDPLSITVGVISLTRLALQSAINTKSLIDGIQGAPQTVKNLSNDSEALYVVLGALERQLDNIDIDLTPAQAAFVPLLQGPLNNCVSAFKDVQNTLKPFVKPSGEANKSKWKGLVFAFREKQIEVLQNALNSTKMSLDIAMSAANMSNTAHEFRDIREGLESLQPRLASDRASLTTTDIGNTDSSGSDYGYPLRNFLRATETVLSGSPPGSPDLDALSVDRLAWDAIEDIATNDTEEAEATFETIDQRELEVGALSSDYRKRHFALSVDRFSSPAYTEAVPATFGDDPGDARAFYAIMLLALMVVPIHFLYYLTDRANTAHEAAQQMIMDRYLL